jgi:hypothetical protein
VIRRGLAVAAAVVLAGNALILVDVGRNRAGNPDAVVRLSERELHQVGEMPEGAAPILNLKLQWSTAPGPDGRPWFDRAALESLGVGRLPEVVDSAAAQDYRRNIRRAYAVLELGGPAWERLVAERQTHADSLQAARPPAAQEKHAEDRPWLEKGGRTESRLLAIDVGRDPMLLREKYPERSRYLILPAEYAAEVLMAEKDSLGVVTAPARVEGRIVQLLPGTVHVPRPLRDSLLALGVTRNDSTVHFEITLKVGKKWEAWVE